MHKLLSLGLLVLAACGQQSPGQTAEEGRPSVTAAAPLPGNFEDAPAPQPGPGEDWSILQAQVALDRAGFSPGVMEGRENAAYTSALRGFQESRSLPVTGVLDVATRGALPDAAALPPVRAIRLTAEFLDGPYAPNLPKRLSQQAGLAYLGYRNALEKLAERFHTTPDYLVHLNGPDVRLRPGAVVTVPNVPDPPAGDVQPGDMNWARTLALLGVPAVQPRASRLTVSKAEGALKVFDADGRLIAQFPATMGSEHDPLPIGEWTIKGVSRNPEFHYNPDLFWDAAAKDRKATLGPGPNGPVGIVWIDLSKPHYGIHGTPEPALIGKTQSHGCIRLTNWDAARLAQMVGTGIRAVFTP